MISATSKIGGGPKHIFSLGKNLSNDIKVFYAMPKSEFVSEFINSNNLDIL